MASNRWDQLLSDSTWYVPAANLLAYQLDSTTSDPTPVSDQTIWSIGPAEGGRFTGQSYATIVNPSGVSNSVVTTMDGVVTKSGQVRITFTNPVGSTITGIGQVRKVNGVESIEMQMITGNNGSYTTHWAYMLPLTDSTTPPDPATDLGDQTSYFSTKYRWLLGTRWKFDSLGSKTKGVFTISGYRKGYFWGQGRERGSNETFDVLGSITPEGNFFLNAMDKNDFELRFSQGGRLRGPRLQAKAQLHPYTNNQDQFVLPLSLRRIDDIKEKDLITDGGSLSSPVAKPPAGSSLLFGALADSGKIKQRKNGSYRMVLDGVDEIDWFTDRPNRVEGTWKPRKLLRKWDKYFASSEPNAQVTLEVGDQRELFTFEMFKPKIRSRKMIFNIKPLSDSSEDKVTGLQDIELSDISLFIDDATPGMPSCFPNCYKADLRGLDMSGQNLYSNFVGADFSSKGTIKTNLSGAQLNFVDLQVAVLSGANLSGANLSGANMLFASLMDADLSGANLTDANLTFANLIDANLNGANWSNTTCPDATINSGSSPCTAKQLLLA